MDFSTWKFYNEDKIAKRYLIEDLKSHYVFKRILKEEYEKFLVKDKEFWQDQDIWYHDKGC